MSSGKKKIMKDSENRAGLEKDKMSDNEHKPAKSKFFKDNSGEEYNSEMDDMKHHNMNMTDSQYFHEKMNHDSISEEKTKESKKEKESNNSKKTNIKKYLIFFLEIIYVIWSMVEVLCNFSANINFSTEVVILFINFTIFNIGVISLIYLKKYYMPINEKQRKFRTTCLFVIPAVSLFLEIMLNFTFTKSGVLYWLFIGIEEKQV
ncbi:hypothetical protein EDEG_00397 [Edhazardia aedis USNM 41457]|uniref:Uncharacterized protein n=1 Tax=Edhazardia aedis (strain USNM 41457) TaxID=1003232 RepID=J9DGF6_EDHAE|nr:hypothetical protein EDEG_00397 [Edhazardia aedis USNM 41457]|eukprot:EJW01680.1 hypothetical protein EDEG_00397 [Edhazardia aedis USNM 41457]